MKMAPLIGFQSHPTSFSCKRYWYLIPLLIYLCIGGYFSCLSACFCQRFKKVQIFISGVALICNFNRRYVVNPVMFKRVELSGLWLLFASFHIWGRKFEELDICADVWLFTSFSFPCKYLSSLAVLIIVLSACFSFFLYCFCQSLKQF